MLRSVVCASEAQRENLQKRKVLYRRFRSRSVVDDVRRCISDSSTFRKRPAQAGSEFSAGELLCQLRAGLSTCRNVSHAALTLRLFDWMVRRDGCTLSN